MDEFGLLTSPDLRSDKLKHYFDTAEDNAIIRIKYESERLQDELLAVQEHAEKQYRKIHQLQYEIKQLESRLENLE